MESIPCKWVWTNQYVRLSDRVILFAAWKKFRASCKCWLFQVYLACDDYLGFDWKSPIAVKLIMPGTLTRNIFDKLASLMRYVSCHYFFNDAGAKYNWILIKGKVTLFGPCFVLPVHIGFLISCWYGTY